MSGRFPFFTLVHASLDLMAKILRTHLWKCNKQFLASIKQFLASIKRYQVCNTSSGLLTGTRGRGSGGRGSQRAAKAQSLDSSDSGNVTLEGIVTSSKYC